MNCLSYDHQKLLKIDEDIQWKILVIWYGRKVGEIKLETDKIEIIY